MFVDEALIRVQGGDGGSGCTSFRREKYVPRGGPDGGDGGPGGSVTLVASPDMNTLLEFRFRPTLRAGRGRHGQGSKRTGRSGEELLVRVPLGTTVFAVEGQESLADLVEPDQRFVAAAGGRGGKGNAHFTTSTRRAPTRHQPGEPGEDRPLRLELKLLADVGLVGFPNAGKSTLVSRISAARPKVAAYPFTTLEPVLGVVDAGTDRPFVVADIPGLIEGAHHGAGLGTRFLRHIERCRLVLHLIDPTDPEREPAQAVQIIDAELRGHSQTLADKPRMLVVTKADANLEPRSVAALRRAAERRGESFHVISAVTGQGLTELLRDVASRLEQLGPAPCDP